MTRPDQPPDSEGGTHLGLELRHLRYLVGVADAGTFTRAAEQMFIAQPTLSQQIRRLEEMVGTPLLQRRHEGVRLTSAGRVLVEESRTIISLLEHGVSRSRHAAGLGRPRLRFVLPPYLPDGLAVETASMLRSTAAAAGTDVTWLETPLDAEFTPIRQRRADAGLGWLASAGAALPDHLDVMSLGEFEPEIWVPPTTRAADCGIITLDELAHLQVIHTPRRTSVGTYDAWLSVLRTRQPSFEFTDAPFRHSLPMTLAFAATASRPTAVLTGPLHVAGEPTGRGRVQQAAGCYDMRRVDLERHLLTATAAIAWNCDLPRHLQQVLYDTADSIPLSEHFAAAS
ncbi:MAG TPA: LysR family transcriptional regulator [Trebonia sp.]|nr:LysR family transcriptional regulator [Trebonia sp.]